MRKGRFMEEQMVGIICEADRNPVSVYYSCMRVGSLVNLAFRSSA